MSEDEQDRPDLPWMRFEVARFMQEIMGWDDELTGIFIKLIVCQWVKGEIPSHNIDALTSIAPAAARRWNELSHLFPDGKNPWIEGVHKKTARQYQAKVRGGQTRAKQMAEERERKRQQENGEEADG